MTSIFIITSTIDVCCGHGDNRQTSTLPTNYEIGKPHPAFSDKEAAIKYRNKIDPYQLLEVTELELL